jgi:hypothetical protein
MNKQLYLIVAILLSSTCFAQISGSDIESVSSISDANVQKRVFKVRQPEKDLFESWEVSGLGPTSYTTSNVMDGSVNSYQHSLRIVVGLTTPAYKNGSYQLVFYGADEKIQQAASVENGVVSLYYPVAAYEVLRTRLEQALTARKKVQVKMTQKTNGFREGVLLF